MNNYLRGHTEELAVQTAEQLPPGDRLPSDHPPPHDGPIDSPGAWYGSDLQDRSEWKYVLSEQERAELLAATRAARQLSDNIMDIGKEDFVLPTFAKQSMT